MFQRGTIFGETQVLTSTRWVLLRNPHGFSIILSPLLDLSIVTPRYRKMPFAHVYFIVLEPHLRFLYCIHVYALISGRTWYQIRRALSRNSDRFKFGVSISTVAIFIEDGVLHTLICLSDRTRWRGSISNFF